MNAGRNDPCPCGSGMKYKKCCQNKLAARLATQTTQPKVSVPPPAETNRLASLFNSGRHMEMENLARKLLERYPGSGLVWKALGASLKAQNKMALFELQRATELMPDDAEAHYNLGNALKALGRLDDAVASYHRVLKFRPDLAEVHNNLGNALKDLGRLDDAVASYHLALKFRPDYAEAHYNLGSALKDLGRPDDAVASYHLALKFKPDFAEAHSNLGVALNDLGQFDDAVTSYRRALQIKPDYAMALNNLALVLNAQGKSVMSMNCIMQSLQLKETVEAKNIFVTCVKHLHITADNTEVRLALVRALTETWGRPTDLAGVCIDLVKLNPDIQEAMARATNAWPLRLSIQDLFGSGGLTALQSDPLLCALLNSAHIDDIETERFLTTVRCAMLEAIGETKASGCAIGMAMDFYCALANQCFINEYVFSHTDAEIRKAGDLRNSLVAALEAGTEVPALWPIAVATYFPLFSVPLAARLLDTHWPDPVKAVLVQQICEPEEERQLRATISRVTRIEDDVSLLVQNQYEDNPYPRWIKVAPTPKARHVLGYLSQKFPLAVLKYHTMTGNAEVLIAGCGTGQHSIATAKQLHGATVLAVDLSLSSLGYAKRKTRELGLTSIEYVQADLLNLGEIGRDFDVIESVGVLHHLADPWAGWRVLLSILRPGGFMKLGFYSELARRDIVKARAIIAGQGYGTTANEIRKCRQYLLDLDKHENLGRAVRALDFFSTSACRDLLFHVQEHRMTLTAIDSFLRENNLGFLGFELDPRVASAYRLRFPDDQTLTNLGQWQLFESENPDTFFGMYQFWIQKSSVT
ncbi:MAG: tetratricopeptide repeat protein [Betaproteobacteria bacterium]|nr:tetratricopeptide repeat protein [Betaproteobacteria bacterium]